VVPFKPHRVQVFEPRDSDVGGEYRLDYGSPVEVQCLLVPMVGTSTVELVSPGGVSVPLNTWRMYVDPQDKDKFKVGTVVRGLGRVFRVVAKPSPVEVGWFLDHTAIWLEEEELQS